MKAGDVVRIKPLEDAHRSLMYSGWVGTIRTMAPNGRCYVDSDGPGKMQAVSFRAWFTPDELEPVEQ